MKKSDYIVRYCKTPFLIALMAAAFCLFYYFTFGADLVFAASVIVLLFHLVVLGLSYDLAVSLAKVFGGEK